MPLSSKRHRRAWIFLFLLAGAPAGAQQTPAVKPPASTTQSPYAEVPFDTEEVPEVPGLSAPMRGWNAGVTFSGVHESTTGWATLATPSVGYSFNDIFSADATLPIYFFRLAETLSIHPRPDARLTTLRGELGDLIFGLHAQFLPSLFQYQVTGAFAVPTGDETYGLTTGRVTFDINNHFERSFGRFTPNIEAGGGDSTTLVNRILTKNYTSLGPLAHFQAGLGIDLIHGMSFETDAYEQLPIGDQKIYGPSRHGNATIVTGHSAIEDNGFINSLDIPVNGHLTFSGYYARSLRLRTDTAAMGVTYVIRSATSAEESTMDELFKYRSITK
jgi:hypothetical protein